MASFVNRDFNIPDGYIVEETDGQLYHEDLNKDSELWLIRVPTDIQISTLDKKKIYLGNNPNDINVKTIKSENGKILDCCAENCDIPNMCAVLPEKSGKKLQAVCKVFKGAILISEGLSLNDDTEVKSEIEDEPQATAIDDTPNLTHEPKRKKNKKKKKDSLNTDNYDLNDDTEVKSEIDEPQATAIDDTPNLAHEPKRKKNKRKKKDSLNTDNYDLNYETEDAHNASFPVTKQKRSKKHQGVNKAHNESAEIKTEPESMDSDGFPSCRSQN